MLNIHLKRIAAIIAIISFLFTSNIQKAFAADNEAVTYEGLSNKVLVNSGNLFEGANNLFPGDDLSRSIKFRNDSSSNVTFYMVAEDSSDFLNNDEKQLSKELISLIKLKLELTTPDGIVKTIYSGPFSGNPENVENSIGSMMTPITLGRLSAYQSGVIKAMITVPVELNNRYQNSVGKVNWQFYCDVYTDSSDDNDDDKYEPPNDKPTDNNENKPNDNSTDNNPEEIIDITDEEVPLIDNSIDITDEEVPLSGIKNTGDSINNEDKNDKKLNGVNIFVDEKTLGNLPKTGSTMLAETLLEPEYMGYVILISCGLIILFNRNKYNKTK